MDALEAREREFPGNQPTHPGFCNPERLSGMSTLNPRCEMNPVACLGAGLADVVVAGGTSRVPGWTRGLLRFVAWLLLLAPLWADGARGPLEVDGTMEDPWCRSTNRITQADESPARWPGTQRMVRRLEAIREQVDPERVPCRAERWVRALQAQVASTEGSGEEAWHRFRLGQERVRAGHPWDALAEFDRVERLMQMPGGSRGPIRASDLRHHRALAWLRLGEVENCVDGHRAESCLFPLSEAGQHRRPRGSREAIRLLEEQLEAAPGDLRARWLLNLARMTVGEWPAHVRSEWLIPPQAFESEADVGRFPDVAGRLGVDVFDLAGGCVVDDFDNDGYLDLAVSSSGLDGQLRLFRNDGRGGFRERTLEAGLGGLVGGLNLQQTDYDNDGWLDLWVLRGGWLGTAGRIPNSLLRNRGDGTFEDVTEAAGLASEHPTQTSVWFDFDGDGWLDLFIGNETWEPTDPDPCELYRNRGDGTFVECAAELGLRVARLVKGVAGGDFDNDGRTDLYLSCQDGPNLLYRNERLPGSAFGVRFREVSGTAGVAETVHSFPTWFFDYDNDGAEDLFVSGYRIRDVGEVAADYLGLRHYASKPRLYRNRGDGTFENVTAVMGLDRVCLAMGANFGDLDNDGWLDFYLGTGDPDLATLVPNRMFRNDGGRRFQDVTTSGGFGHLQKGHGIAFADFDQDGDQDVYEVLGGAYAGDGYANVLFLNPGHEGRHLGLQLVGTRANRPAIGARIAVTVRTPDGRRTIRRTVNSGGSFGSSPLRQEIGLGKATAVERVEVWWPGSGRRQVFTGVEPDRSYRLREGDPDIVTVPRQRIVFPGSPVAGRE